MVLVGGQDRVEVVKGSVGCLLRGEPEDTAGLSAPERQQREDEACDDAADQEEVPCGVSSSVRLMRVGRIQLEGPFD